MSSSKNAGPKWIVATLSGAVVSMASGFLLASYTIAGITPNYAAPPTLHASSSAAQEEQNWQAAGYDKIGLWEEGTIPVPDVAPAEFQSTDSYATDGSLSSRL